MEAVPFLLNRGQRILRSLTDHRREEDSTGAAVIPGNILSTSKLEESLFDSFHAENEEFAKYEILKE